MSTRRSRLYALGPLLERIPSIPEPKHRLLLGERVFYTLLALVIFLVLAQVSLWGISPWQARSLLNLRFLFASHAGTLAELGISPLVVSGILVQLLVAGRIVGLDLSNPSDRKIFAGVQKLLALALGLLLGSMLVLGGWYGAGMNLSQGAALVLQLWLGAIVIIYLDELITKRGFGTGIGLFVAASVCTRIFWRAFNPFWVKGEIAGALPSLVHAWLQGAEFPGVALRAHLPSALGALATLLIVLALVYVERVRVEVPVVHKPSGARGKFSLRLLYLSVIPLVVATMILSSLRILGALLSMRGIFILGTIGRAGEAQGLIYYLTPPQGVAEVLEDPLRALVYLAIFLGICVGVAKLWMSATGLRAEETSRQLKRLGFDLPRARLGITGRIWPSALVGALAAAALAVGADFLGAFATGAGLIVTVSVLHRFYREVLREHSWDLELRRGRRPRFEGEVCPACGSGRLVYSGTHAGWTFPSWHAAQSYLCKSCGYVGSVVVELTDEREVEKLKRYHEQSKRPGIELSQPAYPPGWAKFWAVILALAVIVPLAPLFIALFF